MSNILTIAYTTEGTTDERFLGSVIQNAFESAAFNCEDQIEVFEPIFIKFPKIDTFVNDAIAVAKKAFDIGINVLCIHMDADSPSNADTLKYKFNPAVIAINKENNGTICKNLVAIIPIYMTEAWMLADKNLFKEEIGTTKSDIDLGINKAPENISNPKKIIEEALVIAQNHLPKRRDRIAISDLYQPLGQKTSIDELIKLDSFKNFQLFVNDSLKKLNYLK
ncbi:MAG: DUF4276 family protein [Bacteroidota bacterium]